MRHYRVCGLFVSSDLELPGAIETARDDAPDVVIAAGEVPPTIGEATACGPNWCMRPGTFLLAVPKIVRFLIEDGRRISYAVEHGLTADDVSAFVANPAFGILLQQRREVTLHATAVQVGGSAVLFCGPSAAGKSTLAAVLVARGRPLVTDEIAAVRIGGGCPPSLAPGGRFLRLWQSSIERLSLERWKASAVRPTLNRFNLAPPAAVTAALPIAAVYILLETRPPRHSGIQRVNVAQAASLLRRNAYRPSLVSPMRQEALYLDGAMALHRHGGIFELSRDLTYAALPETVVALEAHWAMRGIEEGDI